MFQSATVKLTAWYLAIIIVISLIFSVVIYAIAAGELDTRITYLQKNSRQFVTDERLETLRDTQIHQAEGNLVLSLFITNLFIWTSGGVGSYYLARRTLRPIEEAHEAQSRFTSDASHELRTPLASMKTEIEVALRDVNLSKSDMRELLSSNLEEVNKLTKLSQTLLQLSQLDHENLEKEQLILAPIAQSVIERLDKSGQRIILKNPSQAQTQEKHSKPYSIVANKASVEELFTILLDNALKYSPPDSEVTVTLARKKHMTGFAVANSGQGIAADVLPHIFDRFYRADTSRTSSEKKSYGLGLSLAKKIVELHGGELTVSSAPNEITTFSVFLPNISQVQAKINLAETLQSA